MTLETLIQTKATKMAVTGSLSTVDAFEIEREIQRFLLDAQPSTLAGSNFQASGTAPAGSVPLTVQSISSAIIRAAEAEDAHARRNAAIAGAVISLLIGAGVTALTGGTVTPALAGSIVATAKPLLGSA